MIKLQDTIIQTETEDIINVLRSELVQKGMQRFSIVRHNGENLQTNCPFHKGGQERKPSFGINGEKDKCHCFACGWSGSIEEMVSEIFGYMDDGKYGKRWLIKRFNSIEIETRPNIMEGFNGRIITNNRIILGNTNSNSYFNSFEQNIQSNKRVDRFGQNIQYNKQVGQKEEITEEELDKYRYIHPYMYQRGLTDEIIERFDIGYDREREEITFPVADLSGTVRFIAGRSVKSKFFRLPKSLDKPVYCGYEFVSGRYKVAYIVESFLNCLTCWKYDKPAMAMIGTGNEKQYEILNRLPVREYILAFDPDEAGRKATERFKKHVHGKIIKELVYPDNRDINDLQEEFLKCKIIF